MYRFQGKKNYLVCDFERLCLNENVNYEKMQTVANYRCTPKVFIRQGRFSEARAQFLFFQISSNKLKAGVAILDLRRLHVYNIFNGTTMVGAVGNILKIMIARLFQIATL